MTAPARSITVAPITSYLGGGNLSAVIAHVQPTEVRNLDLYIGEGLIRELAQEVFVEGKPLRACLSDKEFCPETLADRIFGKLSSSDPPFGVTGLTTYLPEMPSAADGYANSLEAAKQIVKLSCLLRDRGFICDCVEFVGGRTRCVRGDTLTKDSDNALFTLLADSIRQLCSVCDKEPIWLAFEIEPGPACLLGSEGNVLRLTDEVCHLQDTEGLRVGINIDFAHMRAMELAPDHFAGHDLLKAIVHAHLNDGPGFHTPDLKITEATIAQPWWSAWAKTVKDAFAKSNEHRSVSIELEATPYPEMMVESYRVVTQHVFPPMP